MDIEEFNPARQLRSSVINNALKNFIVATVIKKYQVCAVRSICVDGVSKEKIWLTRRVLENLLAENPHVVCFFACITALVHGKKKKKKNNYNNSDSEEEGEEENDKSKKVCPGIAFWIAFDWPESGLAAFEEYIAKEFLSAGFDIVSCKAVRGRGKNSFLISNYKI